MKTNNYPVVEKDIEGGIYHPLDYFPENDWKNKNRKPRTPEEISQLMVEVLGSDCFYPAQHIVCLEEFNPAETSTAVIDARTTTHWWNMGRIIAMGPLAFDTNSFPMGATASYDDYVIFDMHAQRRTKFNNAHIILVKDRSIDGIISDPVEFTRGGRE